jgi:hypothetical protein
MARTRIRGIDEPLPEGETLLWEGRPDARALARHVLRIRWIAGYFAVLAILAAITAGAGAPVAARVVWILVLGGVVAAMAAGYAHLTARNTVYAITDRRVVMRVGLAFPAVFNLPYSKVGGAEVRAFRDGSGEIAFQLKDSGRIGFVYLWPHARPFRLAKPEPALRGLDPVEPVAKLLRGALVDAQVGAEDAPDGEPTPVHFNVMDDEGIEVVHNRRTVGASRESGE